MVEIEKGVEMPERRVKYPWREMEIGDSFVHEGKYAVARSMASTTGRNLGKKFSVRKMPDGKARIWRVA